MRMERPNAKPLSPEEIAHLDDLKSVVERSLQDGRFSSEEIDRIWFIIRSDGKVTYEELRLVNETVQTVTGNMQPEFEWTAYH